MKNFIILCTFTLCFFGCKKESLQEMKDKISNMRPNNLMFGQQCINNPKNDPVSAKSPYRNRKFHDGFNGPSGSSSPATCFTMKPKCGLRLDWFQGGECNFDENLPRYSKIKDLDKCVWKVWHDGYNFWQTNKQFTFRADAVEVSGGTLKLKVLPNPDYDPTKGNCGEEDKANPWSQSYFNTNCPLMSGGIDSKYLDTNMKGYNALYGRIEMKARMHITTTNAAYPALWMWPTQVGTGNPYVATGSDLLGHSNGNEEPRQIGEIDILEFDGGDSRNYAFQSYHQWEFKNKIHAYTTQGRTLKMTDYHTYGVEWSPTSLKFYIDDCYTYEIKKGSTSTHGNRDLSFTISDTASFMMMTIAAGAHAVDANNRDVFEIDEVNIYE
jgi:hypothetical protein